MLFHRIAAIVSCNRNADKISQPYIQSIVRLERLLCSKIKVEFLGVREKKKKCDVDMREGVQRRWWRLPRGPAYLARSEHAWNRQLPDGTAELIVISTVVEHLGLSKDLNLDALVLDLLPVVYVDSHLPGHTLVVRKDRQESFRRPHFLRRPIPIECDGYSVARPPAAEGEHRLGGGGKQGGVGGRGGTR